MVVSLKNYTNINPSIETLAATLSCDDPNVTITNDMAVFEDIDYLMTSDNSINPFTFEINDVNNPVLITFNLKLQWDEYYQYETQFDVLIDSAYYGQEEQDMNLTMINIYPNPFSNSTTLSYELQQPSSVQISIYNHLGKQFDLIHQNQSSGPQQIIWNAEGLPSGVYYFRLQTGDKIASGKMVVVE